MNLNAAANGHQTSSFISIFLSIGRSENKTLTKRSSYENEVKPGVVMTGVFFSVCRM